MVRVALALLVVSLALGGCAKPKAAVETGPTVLDVPPPPPRVIVPPEPEPIPDVPDEPEKGEPRPPRRPIPRVDNRTPPPPKPGEAPPAAVEPPKPAAAAPATVTLQPVLPSSTREVENKVNEQILRADRDLGKVDYGKLSEDAKAQYDMAKRFIEQARSALVERNLVFAGKLAEKAANIAGVLVGR